MGNVGFISSTVILAYVLLGALNKARTSLQRGLPGRRPQTPKVSWRLTAEQQATVWAFEVRFAWTRVQVTLNPNPGFTVSGLLGGFRS